MLKPAHVQPAREDGDNKSRAGLPRVLRENGLSLAFLALFVLTALGQVFAGFADYNSELAQHRQATIGLGRYLTSGHFLEALFENWESEFLQMAVFVVLTVSLRQKGSSESKPLDEGTHDSDEDPRLHEHDAEVPWPVRRGGFWLAVYEHSLTIALTGLFVGSLALHAVFGAVKANQESSMHGEAAQSVLEYLASSQFWYESFQNWQSEFLSVFALIVLSIFLRQRGSSQSKPVAAPHAQTGE